MANPSSTPLMGTVKYKKGKSFRKIMNESLSVFFKDALKSRFLKTIRDNHEHLHETQGGCALWVEREWVRSLIDKE